MLPDEPEESPESILWSAVTVEMALGVIALVLGWLTNVDTRFWLPRLDFNEWQAFLWAGLWGVLATLPMLAAIEIIQRIQWAPFQKLKNLDQSPVISTLLQLSPWELIAVSIAAGVGEELLLRGWLMAWIIDPTPAAPFPMPITIVALVISSIVFGLMHIITPTYAVITAFMGAYLGLLLIWTGNLLVPIVAHAVYDAVHLLMAKYEHRAAANT